MQWPWGAGAVDASGPQPPRSKSKTGLIGEAHGVNLHASLPVHGRDKSQLERLCRYIARPPLAQRAS